MKGGGQKVRYVPRNTGKPFFLAGYPGILPGYAGSARKVCEKKGLCSILVPCSFEISDVPERFQRGSRVWTNQGESDHCLENLELLEVLEILSGK